MGFKSLVSRPKHNGTNSASGLPGAGASVTGTNTSVDARSEDSLAERTRIAQELHDTLLQGFLAVSMQLHAAVDQLPAECPSKPRFCDALCLMDRVLEQGRRAIKGLRSPDEPIESLGQAFAGVPDDLGFPSKSAFRVVVLGKERTLRAGLCDEIYRIGREAIANACRHAQAKDIETEVEYRPTELRIAVRDNGRGFDRQELKWERNQHWGLRGMRERAERIGAQIRVSSRVALGTHVELCVPGYLAFEQAGEPGRLSKWFHGFTQPARAQR